MPVTLEQSKYISLYYREGSSDKEYHVTLEPQHDGYVVNFAYGRRGTTLSTGTKTTAPVDYDAALGIYEKLVREKQAKGYTAGPSGTPYQHTEKSQQVSGLLPQLLNPVDERGVLPLIDSREWVMQEKKDGQRLLLRKAGQQIEGINKKGLLVSVPAPIVTTAREFRPDFVVDGEVIGDLLHVFDLLFLDGEDRRTRPYRERYAALLRLLGGNFLKSLRLVPCFSDPLDKATWLTTFKRQRAEGVVFKRWDAPYTVGRPNSGGSQLKHKFVATLSAVVAQVNQQRSVALRLLNHEGWQPVGNVTIPPNQPIPKVGTVVEVRYLYAYPDGCLFQPVYLGERTDVALEECVLSQVKFKAGEEDDQ